MCISSWCRRSSCATSQAALRGQPESLPRDQPPCPTLLLPELKGADAGGRLLAVELGFAEVDVARDGGITDHGYLQLGKSERLLDLLAGHHPVDELLLGLDPSVGMTVADLSGRY